MNQSVSSSWILALAQYRAVFLLGKLSTSLHPRDAVGEMNDADFLFNHDFIFTAFLNTRTLFPAIKAIIRWRPALSTYLHGIQANHHLAFSAVANRPDTSINLLL